MELWFGTLHRAVESPEPGFKSRLLHLDELAGQNESGEKEDEFDERHGDQHGRLHLSDCFWLSSHALHRRVSDEAEADSDAENCESESESCHDGFLMFSLCIEC